MLAHITKQFLSNKYEYEMRRRIDVKTLVVVALLSFSASPASAKWTKIGEAVRFIDYVDFDTVRKNGEFKTFWQLSNFKEKNGEGELSRRLLVEMDCGGKRSRLLAVSGYSGQMATGSLLSSLELENSEWDGFVPGTLGMDAFKAICRRKNGK